ISKGCELVLSKLSPRTKASLVPSGQIRNALQTSPFADAKYGKANRHRHGWRGHYYGSKEKATALEGGVASHVTSNVSD
ncbi:hypothetical protein BaRGS_00001345, partial [Batillaria attramentaria]